MTTEETAYREARSQANDTREMVFVVYAPNGWALPRHSYFAVTEDQLTRFYPDAEILDVFVPNQFASHASEFSG